MTHTECENLFGAAKSLLKGSGLASYRDENFVLARERCDFEKYWKSRFGKPYGRYMAWVWFSVGAENLVKAALVCNGSLEGKPKKLGYPVYRFELDELDRKDWIKQVLDADNNSKGNYGHTEALKYDYTALGRIWRGKLDKLSAIEGDKMDELKAAYRYLTEKIRNRDAHTYVFNQRMTDFPVVGDIFIPAFNTLVRAMKDNGHFKMK